MTRFPQPVELDAVLDTKFEPVADVVLHKAKDLEAEMLVVVTRGTGGRRRSWVAWRSI